MAVRVSFSIEGEEQVIKSLDRFNLENRDMTPLWNSLANSFAWYERQQFNSQGTEFGNRWPDVISDRYRYLKNLFYPGQPVMVASGALRNQLTKRPLGVEIFRQLSMTVGTNLKYAQTHDKGNSHLMSFEIGGHTVVIHGVPKRQLVGINASMANSWTKKIQRFLVRNEVSGGEEP